MGKAFKSGLCTYCSVAGSTTADRVFARLIPGLGDAAVTRKMDCRTSSNRPSQKALDYLELKFCLVLLHKTPQSLSNFWGSVQTRGDSFY